MARDRLPKGKGWYIWVITQTMAGNPILLAQTAKEHGIQHLLFHIHDGYLGETKVLGGTDLTPFIKAAHAAGIECWGWGAVYKTTWSQGADRVIEAFNKHPELIGYVIDGEYPFKYAPNEAIALMKKLRYFLPNIPIGLSSYRFPGVHPEFPWKEFRQNCDFDMPQVYWEQDFRADAGERQLQTSYTEFTTSMIPKLPYIPTGPIYKVNSWQSTREQILGFVERSKNLSLSGVNMWVWYQAMRDLPIVYNAYMNYVWPGADIPAPPPSQISLEEKVDKLWSAHPELH